MRQAVYLCAPMLSGKIDENTRKRGDCSIARRRVWYVIDGNKTRKVCLRRESLSWLWLWSSYKAMAVYCCHHRGICGGLPVANKQQRVGVSVRRAVAVEGPVDEQ